MNTTPQFISLIQANRLQPAPQSSSPMTTQPNSVVSKLLEKESLPSIKSTRKDIPKTANTISNLHKVQLLMEILTLLIQFKAHSTNNTYGQWRMVQDSLENQPIGKKYRKMDKPYCFKKKVMNAVDSWVNWADCKGCYPRPEEMTEGDENSKKIPRFLVLVYRVYTESRRAAEGKEGSNYIMADEEEDDADGDNDNGKDVGIKKEEVDEDEDEDDESSQEDGSSTTVTKEPEKKAEEKPKEHPPPQPKPLQPQPLQVKPQPLQPKPQPLQPQRNVTTNLTRNVTTNSTRNITTNSTTDTPANNTPVNDATPMQRKRPRSPPTTNNNNDDNDHTNEINTISGTISNVHQASQHINDPVMKRYLEVSTSYIKTRLEHSTLALKKLKAQQEDDDLNRLEDLEKKIARAVPGSILHVQYVRQRDKCIKRLESRDG